MLPWNGRVPYIRYHGCQVIAWSTLQRRAQLMRARPTQAEQCAWSALSLALKSYDVKLVFQEPIGFYIVDFMIYPQRVAVEIDGRAHRGREEYDARRDSYLRGLNVRVLRFSNDFVLADSRDVARTVVAACKPLRPLPPSRKPAAVVKARGRKKRGERRPAYRKPIPNALSGKSGIVVGKRPRD